jgi:uncharacterized protein (TIRG00374 family)
LAATHLRTALVSILAIALLAWFLRNANLASVWGHVRHARVDLLLAGLGFVASTYWVRVIRWQHLLAPVGPTRFRTAFRTTVIGFAALSVLPARAGDVLRPYLLAKQEGLSPPATFATVVLERVLDVVAVVALLAVFVWGFADPSDLPPRLARPVIVSAALAAAASVVLMVLMWLLASHPERVGRLVYASARVLPHRIADRLAEFARLFSSGFAAARTPGSLMMAFLWSFPVWLTISAQAWVVTRAFGIEMPFTGSFLVQALLVIGVAVPTPGGVGGFHVAYRWGTTTFFHAPNDAAVAAAIVVHAISFIPVVLVGILFMAQDGLSVHRLQELAGEAREKEMPHTDEVPILRSPGR